MPIADLLLEAHNCYLQHIPVPEYSNEVYNIQDESYEDIQRAVHQIRLLHLNPLSSAHASHVYLEALSQIPSYVKQKVYSFIIVKNWANAAHWMCLYHMPYPDDLRTLAKKYPKQLYQAFRIAQACDLTTFLLQLACSLMEGNNWTMEGEFLRAHLRAHPLKDTDLSHIEPGWGTPWNVWSIHVQPILDAAPLTDGYVMLNTYGQQIFWATPLPKEHLHVLHMSLHPKDKNMSPMKIICPEILRYIIKHTQR